MAKDIKKHVKGLGIEPVDATGVTQAGEMEVLSTDDNKLQYHNGTDASPVVTEAHEATLTNKTINSDNNTLDLDIGVLRADNGNSDRVLKRDNNGVVISGNAVPDDTEIVTIDASQDLFNKQMSGLDNTFINIPENALQTIPGDANKVLKRDGSGNVTSQFLTSDDVGLGNVDNTSDLNKPISTATQAALDDKANITLNNLGTTSINADLIPQADIDLGSVTNEFTTVHASNLRSSQPISINTELDTISGSSPISINTGPGATSSGNLTISTGVAGSFSGSILLNTGSASTRGELILNARSISASNTQIKQLANPTDGTDAVNLQTLQEEITKSGGDINFLALSGVSFNGENGTIGFVTYKDADNARPVDGTGGSPSVTITTSSTNPLTGDNSLIISKPASNVRGEGVSANFSIDRANQARVLKVEFDYNVATGSFVAGTTSADSDVIVYLYDVTNNRLIEPSTFKLFSNSTTVADRFSGYFQTSADSLDYRLIFHVATTSAVAFDLRVDNIIVTPSKYVFGTPITDWQSYTPTITGLGTGSAVNLAFYYRRVGDSLEVTGRWGMLTAGSGSTVVRVSAPTGLSFDATKFNNDESIGLGSGNRLSGSARTPITVTSGASGIPNTFAFVEVGGAAFTGSILPINAQVGFEAQVPIQGWSSSVRMSDEVVWIDDIGKIDAFAIPSANPPPGYLFCNGAAVSRTVYRDLFNKIGTIHGQGDGSTTFNLPDYRGRFLRGQDGGIARDPDRGSRTAMNTGGNTGDNVGSVQGHQYQSHTHTTDVPRGTGAGASVHSMSFQASNAVSTITSSGAGGNETRPINAYVNYFIKFTRHASPVLAQGEVVAAKYTVSSAPSVPNSGFNIVNFITKEFDTHGAVTTGASWNFKAPFAGFYEIKTYIHFNATTYAIGNTRQAQVYVNNVGRDYLFHETTETANPTVEYQIEGSTVVEVTAGSTIDVRFLNNRTAGATNLVAFGNLNYIIIKKVG